MKQYWKYLYFTFATLAVAFSCSDNNTNPQPTPQEVLGCTNPNATNYNPNATKDDGSCALEVLGCTDPDATNYNPNATTDDGSCTYKNTEDIEALPSSFSQKVVLEYFTGNWCGLCTEGQEYLDNVLKKHPNRAIAAIPHTKDAMMLPEYRAYMKFELDGQFAPGATVNRTVDPSAGEVYLNMYTFPSFAEELLSSNSTTDIGLAIQSSFQGEELTVTTHTGFLADKAADYKLFVLVLEDSVVGTGDGYDQANYSNDTPQSPYYGLGNPIVGYHHRYVLRAYAHDVDGEAIPASEVKANHVYIKTNTFNIANYRKEYLSIVAFIVEDKGKPIESPIINGQSVVAGKTKNWD